MYNFKKNVSSLNSVRSIGPIKLNNIILQVGLYMYIRSGDPTFLLYIIIQLYNHPPF